MIQQTALIFQGTPSKRTWTNECIICAHKYVEVYKVPCASCSCRGRYAETPSTDNWEMEAQS